MAEGDDGKTEEPTGKRLEEARAKGSVAYTREMGSVLGMLAIITVIYQMGVTLYSGMESFFHATFSNLHPWQFGSVPFWNQVYPYVGGVFHVVAMIFFVAFVAPLIAHFAQKGISPMFEAAMPNIEKLDPMNGIQKLFSFEALTTFGKSAVKAVGLILIYYYVVKPYLYEIAYSAERPYESALSLYGSVIVKYLIYCVIFLVAVVVIDYELQRRHHIKSLMMSRQEVKDENKETEGSPEIKGKVREIQRERSKRQIDKEVPKATVIITNPTHFAVAVRYQRGVTPVPRVVAKGVDVFCMRIRELAKKNNVPIVENPPLARALYRDVKVGQDIPKQFYKAVAKIIATIIKLEQHKKAQNQATVTPPRMR